MASPETLLDVFKDSLLNSSDYQKSVVTYSLKVSPNSCITLGEKQFRLQ
jgi:hypothetical protein